MESDVPGSGASAAPWLLDVVESMLDADRVLPLFRMLESTGATEHLPGDHLMRIASSLRAQGYLHAALDVADQVASNDLSSGSRLSDSLRAELRVLGGHVDVSVESGQRKYVPVSGRVLCVVGSSLPQTDSSYTRDTHSFAKRGPALGVVTSVVTQMGIAEADGYEIEEFDEISYHRIPGPRRGAISFDEWLKTFTTRLAAVVRKVRPAVLIASSDFVNGMAARAVGEAYNIPLIYDVRGLWEDSWLKRRREEFGWSREQVPDRWGMPEVWQLRRERELELIQSADAVVVSSAALETQLLDLGAAREKLSVIESTGSPDAVWSKLLESMGVVEEGSSALAEVRYSAAELRRVVSASERRRLGNVETFAGWGSVETIRERGWQHASLEPVKITVPFDWISACKDHRSQAFHLHAWDFMVPFFEAWDKDRDPDVLVWCIERAADWAQTFSNVESHGSMAWYDMAIGLRAPRLAYLLQEAVFEDLGSEALEVLTQSVIDHQRGIFASHAFNPNTNHGFYTAVGQLSFATRLRGLPGMDVIVTQGRERLRRIVATQFAPDGGHLEHSPDYHRMLVSSFLGAMDDGLLTDPDVARRVVLAEEVMGWMLRPDRTVVQIGDSPSRLAVRSDRAMGAAHTKFLVTEGRDGEPNTAELMVLPDAGYAMVRSPQPRGTDDHLSAGYLTLMAGFHSRTHKHCDDLSVTLFDGGHEILIDAGRFGYLDQLPADSPQRDEGFFYARAERQYVERTRAHNTVEADGKDHDRRNRQPYGSALISGGEHDGLFELIGEVDHGHWIHRRAVKYRPGRWLLVEDSLKSTDGQPHDYLVWWNFPESLTAPVADQNRVRFTLPDGRSLHVATLGEAELLPPVKGQHEPMRGWRSRVDYELTPAWSLGYRSEQTAECELVTLISFDEVPARTELR